MEGQTSFENSALGNSKSEREFYYKVSQSISADENILWASSPKGVNTIYAFQKSFFNRIERWIFYLLLLLGSCFCFFYMGSYLYGIMGITYLLYRLVMDSFAILHQARTHYALTEKRIFIQTWRKFRKKFDSIDLDNIKAMQMVETDTNQGTVFIMCYVHPGIYTVDYSDGQVQAYPTLEDIEYPDQLINLINTIKKHT